MSALPVVAAHDGAQAAHAGRVVLAHLARRLHQQRAGARHLRIGVDDVAAGLDQRQVARIVVQRGDIQAHDVAARPHRYRHGGLVPGVRAAAGIAHVDHRAALQAEDVARDRVEPGDGVIARVQRAVRGRSRPEDEQRLVVPQRPRLHAILAGIGQDGIAVRDLEGAEGRTPGRGQRRIGRRHRHGMGAIGQDGAARQHLELAARRRRQQQHRVVVARGIVGQHDVAAGRHGAHDGRIHEIASAVRRHSRDIGGQFFSQEPAVADGHRGEVAAGREQIDRGGRRPQREPAVAAADDRIRRADHLVGTGIDLRDAAGVADAAQHQVGARVDPGHGVAQHQARPAHDPAPGHGIRIRSAQSRTVAVAQVHAAHLSGRQADPAAQVAEHAVQVQVVGPARMRRPDRLQLGGAQRGIEAAADAQVQIAAAGQHQVAVQQAAGAGDHRRQPLRARRHAVDIERRVAARVAHARVAAGGDADVAAAQRAEAGETHHPRFLVAGAVGESTV